MTQPARLERSTTPAASNLPPGRAAALAYIAGELDSGRSIPPATLAWMAKGALLSGQLAPELELLVEGDIVPGRENSFVLRNAATGNGDFDIPDDPAGVVTDAKTGKVMGTLRAITDFGRWIVGVAHYVASRATVDLSGIPGADSKWVDVRPDGTIVVSDDGE